MLKYAVLLAFASVSLAQQAAWQQCGGIGWTGQTTCVAGYACSVINPYYSQCIPGTATPPPTSVPPNSIPPSSTPPSSVPPSSAPSSTPTAPAGALPRLGGVNTAGYDFSVATDGSFKNNVQTPPPGQFTHFAQQGVNLFRVPFAWQLMTPTVGGTIDSGFLSRYDATVQAALNSGPKVMVIIDLHNYARWNGAIIAQGGPTDAQFQSLWTQLAQKYGSNQRIIFGIMNEPHDLQSVSTWVTSVQGVVNAIRKAGAQNYLLLPGSSWASAQAFPTEAGPALIKVTDPLGGTSKLIFDVHKYLDSDNSGTHPDCTTDNTAVLQTLTTFLQQNGNRQAILSETGGGNTSSCQSLLKNELAFVKNNYPTLAGFAVWSAGAFQPSYVLSVTPNADGSDQPLWTAAVKPNLPTA